MVAVITLKIATAAEKAAVLDPAAALTAILTPAGAAATLAVNAFTAKGAGGAAFSTAASCAWCC